MVKRALRGFEKVPLTEAIRKAGVLVAEKSAGKGLGRERPAGEGKRAHRARIGKGSR